MSATNPAARGSAIGRLGVRQSRPPERGDDQVADDAQGDADPGLDEVGPALVGFLFGFLDVGQLGFDDRQPFLKPLAHLAALLQLGDRHVDHGEPLAEAAEVQLVEFAPEKIELGAESVHFPDGITSQLGRA